MGYFNLRCFDAKIGKYIIIALNVVVAILGVTHWGYAGMCGKMRSQTKTAFSNLDFGRASNPFDSSMDNLYASPIAYFAISGVVQVLVSVLVILLVLQVVGKENRLLWVRIGMVILMVQFAFDFFIAVYTSMMISYWNSSLATYLNQTSEFIDDIPDQNLKRLYKTIINFFRYSMAEAIFTWIVAIPAIVIIFISLTDQFLTVNSVNIITLENPQAPQLQNIQNQAPVKVYPVNQNSLSEIAIKQTH